MAPADNGVPRTVPLDRVTSNKLPRAAHEAGEGVLEYMRRAVAMRIEADEAARGKKFSTAPPTAAMTKRGRKPGDPETRKKNRAEYMRGYRKGKK